MDNTSTCKVCACNYNKTIRKKVVCRQCKFELCRKCFELYGLTKFENYHCMNCKHQYSFKDMYEQLSHASMKRLFIHFRNVLFER